MIIGIEGAMGSGKTILMVRYLLKDLRKEIKIFSNMKGLKFPHEIFDMKNILETKELYNVSVGIDELTVFADCRRSSSKMNRLISYFILQSRKRNVNIYYTTQNLSMIDLRLINHTNYQIIAEKIYDEDGDEIKNIRHYTIFDITDIRHINMKKFALKIDRYYKFYDTNEVILPPI